MRPNNAPKSQTILQGTVLTVAMRWTDRLIGLISTLILARLLVPEDFGIIAMASLAIGLADVMLDLGVNIALIQNRNVTQAHFNTAWTLRLIQTAIATLLVLATAPLAAEYFKNDRLQPVLQVLAFSILISGFENIGIIRFQKEMQFGAEFRFMFLRRMAGFLVTIGAAWFLHSYWALVIGTLAGRVIGVGFGTGLQHDRKLADVLDQLVLQPVIIGAVKGQDVGVKKAQTLDPQDAGFGPGKADGDLLIGVQVPFEVADVEDDPFIGPFGGGFGFGGFGFGFGFGFGGICHDCFASLRSVGDFTSPMTQWFTNH